MNNRRILITGGAGFVGSNLAIGLKKKYEDVEVIAYDNLKRRGSELNVKRLKKSGIEFIRADVRDYEDLAAVGKVDTIIECSAEPSVLAGYNESPRYLIETNLMGAINCLELARVNKANFIFISTSRIYPIDKINQIQFREEEARFTFSPHQKLAGVSKRGITEDFPLEGIRSLYGATKLAAELMLQEYIYAYKIRGVINRCGVISGPWQMGKIDQGFVALWIASHFFKKGLNYIGFNGTGKQVRDVLHVDDLLELVDKELQNIDKVNGRVYNVGGGLQNTISLVELTEMCRKVSGNNLELGKIKEDREVDIRGYISDYSKVKSELNWEPKRNVEEVVEDTYKWIFDNREDLRQIFFKRGER